MKFGINLITTIEYLHELGYVHCDIKPDNIMTGSDNSLDSLYLIDFGKTRKYLDSDGKHLPNKPTDFNYNEWFASIN